MNKQVNEIIERLDNCIGVFDYLMTPEESSLLVIYIKDLQYQSEQNKHRKKVINRLSRKIQRLKQQTTKHDIKEIINLVRFKEKYINQQLEHNWNELKKWLEEEESTFGSYRYDEVLNKIKKLEEGGKQ